MKQFFNSHILMLLYVQTSTSDHRRQSETVILAKKDVRSIVERNSRQPAASRKLLHNMSMKIIRDIFLERTVFKESNSTSCRGRTMPESRPGAQFLCLFYSRCFYFTVSINNINKTQHFCINVASNGGWESLRSETGIQSWIKNMDTISQYPKNVKL